MSEARWGVVLTPSDDGAPTAMLPRLLDDAAAAAASGAEAVYVSQRYSWDAIGLAAVVAGAAPGLEIGTAAVPIHPRHPLSLYAQAQVAQATASAAGGQFVLGLGLGVARFAESVFGTGPATERPLAAVRAYLRVLDELGHGRATLSGRYRASPPSDLSLCPPAGVLLAALSPRSLQVAGELADGTIPHLTGPRTLATFTVPTITAAARAAGRLQPRVIVAVAALVTHRVDEVRTALAAASDFYLLAPSYVRLLEREPVQHPAELAVLGDESAVAAGLRAHLEAGATGVLVTPVPGATAAERERTWQLLGSLARERTAS